MSNQNKNIATLIARVLVKSGSEVLLVRRSETAKSRAEQWEMPGGIVDDGESLEDGARRELLEETGIKAKDLDYVLSKQYTLDSGEHRLGALFTTEMPKPEVTLSDEHDDYGWFDHSTINNVNVDKHQLDSVIEIGFKGVTTPAQGVQKTTKVDVIVAYTDGGSRGNPGPSASGYVLMNEQKEVLEEGGEYLGITTNNQAEYQAVKLALEKAGKYQPKKIEFFIDSLLVVNQMNGVFKIKNRDLWPIHDAIKQLAKKYESVTFTHVRREKNKLADAKVNEVLDSRQD